MAYVEHPCDGETLSYASTGGGLEQCGHSVPTRVPSGTALKRFKKNQRTSLSCHGIVHLLGMHAKAVASTESPTSYGCEMAFEMPTFEMCMHCLDCVIA